jgi:cytochrome oxidase Cu insertion factor (SCO1/SenC/PrrC family)
VKAFSFFVLLFLLVGGGCSTSRPPAPAVAAAAAPSDSTDELFVSPMLAPAQRPALNLDHRVTTQDGAVTSLRQLADRPMAISFAFSRCSNPNKCPRVVNTMGLLRGDLERAGLLGRVRLAVITYDPEHDTHAVMRSFAKLNEYPMDEQALFLRPDADSSHRLFQDLGARASFNDHGVALHGIQLLLLDKNGRLARTYHTLIWDNRQVARDLRQLANE